MSPLPKAPFNPDPRDSASPFGVLDFMAWDHDWNRRHYSLDQIERAADLMAGAGIGWVRLDLLWLDIEPTPGRFEFKRYDKILAALESRNIRVLGILHYNPAWRGVAWNTAPNPDDYLRYAMAACDHFKDKIRYWEIWNEPDQDIYWIPQDGMTAYSELLRKVTPALKKVDPTCKVLLGGLSKQVPVRLGEVYAKAGKEAFDIVNLHPFVNPLDADPLGQLDSQHQEVLNRMAENQDAGKPIWWTEIGCPGMPKAEPSKGWWLGKGPTEEAQAEWVTRLYGQRSRWPEVEKIFWAFFRDTPGHFHDDIDHFGLIRSDLTPKPAYEAYRALSRRSL